NFAFATIFTSARGFGGRCASANSPRQLEEVIQCLIQTLVRSQLWVCWSARFVGNELAPAARPQTMRAGFRHARDRGPQRTDAPMQLPRGHLVRMDSCTGRGWRSPQGLRRFLASGISTRRTLKRLLQQFPVAFAHAALSMDANSALKPEAPRIFTFVSRKPYDVTPTTALRVRLREPVGAALSGSPKFWTQGPPLEPPAMSLPYSNALLPATVLPTR